MGDIFRCRERGETIVTLNPYKQASLRQEHFQQLTAQSHSFVENFVSPGGDEAALPSIMRSSSPKPIRVFCLAAVRAAISGFGKRPRSGHSSWLTIRIHSGMRGVISVT